MNYTAVSAFFFLVEFYAPILHKRFRSDRDFITEPHYKIKFLVCSCIMIRSQVSFNVSTGTGATRHERPIVSSYHIHVCRDSITSDRKS